jgi:hypothetical protein
MLRFPAFRPGLAVLLVGLFSAIARPAYAVPHIEFGGEALLILLLLALGLLFGVPVGVGLLMRWLLLRASPGPRTGFYRPLAFATVGWLGVCFLVRLLTADLDPGAAAGLLPAGLGLLAAVGAAAAGVRADQADAAETPGR